MGQYIDKATIVAEIERLKECNRKICGGDFDFLKKTYPKHYYSTEIYNDILSFLNTLEVKEFDMPVLDNRKMSVERWKEACKAACSDRNYRSHYGFTETRDDYFVDGVQWADEHPEIKEEDLEKEIEKYLLTNAKLLIESDSKLVVHHIAEHFFKLGIQQAQKGE